MAFSTLIDVLENSNKKILYMVYMFAYAKMFH